MKISNLLEKKLQKRQPVFLNNTGSTGETFDFKNFIDGIKSGRIWTKI